MLMKSNVAFVGWNWYHNIIVVEDKSRIGIDNITIPCFYEYWLVVYYYYLFKLFGNFDHVRIKGYLFFIVVYEKRLMAWDDRGGSFNRHIFLFSNGDIGCIVICIACYKSLKNFSTESGSSRKEKLMQQYPSSIWINLFCHG
jgi:hypothetical protein